MSDCRRCEEIHKENNTLCDCDKCDKPIIFQENFEALEVCYFCRHQLIISFDGVVGVDLKAVKVAMDLLGIEDQVICADKVIAFMEESYRKKDQ